MERLNNNVKKKRANPSSYLYRGRWSVVLVLKRSFVIWS